MTITVDLSIYSLDLVLRTCHVFTSRCFVTPHTVANGRIGIEFVARDEKDSLRDLAGAFSNALLDSHLRAVIATETHTIRELLVAQAFCEADLLDRSEIESDEHADPRGIAG
jgi:His-Xaa-Ser system protein HxsD